MSGTRESHNTSRSSLKVNVLQTFMRVKRTCTVAAVCVPVVNGLRCSLSLTLKPCWTLLKNVFQTAYTCTVISVLSTDFKFKTNGQLFNLTRLLGYAF